MNFVVIGTDHTIQQSSEPGFAALLRGWLGGKYVVPLEAIAEEYHDKLPPSLGKRLADEHRLSWHNIDMTAQEKADAGIMEDQVRRPKFAYSVAYRVPSDEVREAAWIEKLLNSGAQTALVICGYVHFDPLVKKLRAAGHSVDARVYLETVPEIRILGNPED